MDTPGTRVKVAAWLLAVLAMAACRKPVALPAEPSIRFKGLEQYGDSASLVIAFTDGDGDIGLDDSDNQPPFDAGSGYYHNLFVEADTVRNGAWGRVQFQLPLYYRIPRITPTGQDKTLEGEITVALKPWPIAGTAAPPWDSMRFTVKLVDRALHESNTVQSPAVRVVP